MKKMVQFQRRGDFWLHLYEGNKYLLIFAREAAQE
jgi:hypothetical protein